MDRGVLCQAVALLLVVCSLGPTSRCPGTWGGGDGPQGTDQAPSVPGLLRLPDLCPVELSWGWGIWTARDRCHRVTNHPGLAG